MDFDVLKRIDTDVSTYCPKFMAMFRNPKSFFNTKKTKKENKDNYCFLLVLFILFIVLQLICSNNDVLLKTVFSLFILVSLSVCISLLSLIYADIPNGNRWIFVRYNLILCFFVFILQSILLYFFRKFGYYIFYIANYIFTVFLCIWLFIYLPIRISKTKQYIFFNVILVFAFSCLVNLALNTVFNYFYIKKYKDSNKIVLFQDPVFTESYNELEKVIEIMNYSTTVLNNLANYSIDDILDAKNRDLIILQCDKLIAKRSEIENSLTELHFTKTKDFYNTLFMITDKTQRIKDLYYLMIQSNKTLDDFDISNYKEKEYELNTELDENVEFLHQIEEKIQFLNIEFDKIQNIYEEKQQAGVLTNKEKELYKKQLTELQEEQEDISVMLKYLNTMLDIFGEKTDSLEKKYEMDSFEIKVLQENIQLYSEILLLLQSINDDIEQELNKYKRLLNYSRIRIFLAFL